MNKRIIEKFFNNTCTVDQAEQVVEWFATEEGQTYLSKRLNEDVALLKNENIKPILPELNSEKIWGDIEGELDLIEKQNKPTYYRKRSSSYWYVAAMIFLVCGLSVFYYLNYSTSDEDKAKQVVHVVTGAQQQKEITLNDGTTIKLNSNSQLWISSTYGQPKREVTLRGEAYFEVIHNQAKPFIIHTQGISIKDLGTSFNVRAIPGGKNVQVAVKSGKVSILDKKNAATKKGVSVKAIKLKGGQFAYINLKTNAVSINEFEVKNYFSWMSDRLSFNNVSLANASKQLSHIYGVTFSYAADSLKAMTFSAKFERESLKRTLAVISLTLSIDYQIKNNQVIWKEKK